MSDRKRTTWKKESSAPPATPGYADYFADDPHPAAQPAPDMHKYENGDTSSWAEDPHPGPYEQSPHPATPWEGVSHPAAKPEKQARSLRAAVERKASKCVKIAQAMLGPYAPEEVVENQAFDMMDLSNDQLDSTLQRVLAKDKEESKDEEKEGKDEDKEGKDEDKEGKKAKKSEEDQDEEADKDEDKEGKKKASLEDQVRVLTAAVANLKKAQDQNDPDAYDFGDTIDENPDNAEKMLNAMIAEEECKGCSEAGDEEAHTLMDEMDTDGDGFITRDEWTGSPAVFDALDTDGDGILTVEEVSAGIGPSFAGAGTSGMGGEMMAQDEEEAGDDTEAMLQSMIEEEAKKSQPEEEAMFDEMGEDEDPETEAMFEAMLEEEGQDAPLDEPVMEEALEEDAVVLAEDPMGLDSMMPQQSDDDILANLYGARMAADDENEETEETEETEKTDDNGDEETEEKDEEKTEEKEGKKKAAAQRPRPKKASTGVKTLGRVAKATTGNKEVDELSNLWESAPNVKDVFGN